MRYLCGALLLLASFACTAGEYANEHFSVTVPDGFIGPVKAKSQSALMYGFSKKHTDSDAASIFQITVFDFGASMKDASEKNRLSARDTYLKQFLGGVKRRRTNFVSGNIMDAKIGTTPARSMKWRGKAFGERATGRVFLTIVGTKMFTIHIQDLSRHAKQSMPVLEEMVASIKLKGG